MHLPLPTIPLPTIPLLNHISTLHQCNLLALLLLLSYYHKRTRYLLASLILTLIAYKTLLPIVWLGYRICKGIAMLGFYWHYFEMGMRLVVAGMTGVVVFLVTLTKGIEEARVAQGMRGGGGM